MEKIGSTEEFLKLYGEAKARCGALLTNCVMPKKTVREALEEGRVLCAQVTGGIVLFADRGDPWTEVYYFLSPDAPFPATGGPGEEAASMDGMPGSSPGSGTLRPGSLLLLEESDANGRRAGEIAAMAEKLSAAGFRLAARNLEYAAHFEEPGSLPDMETLPPGYAFAGEPAARAAEAAALWDRYLKPTDVPAKHRDLSDPSRRLVCVTGPDGKLAAVNFWTARGRICEIRHTVTAPACRKKGIALALIRETLRQAAGCGLALAVTLIDAENTGSRRLYEKAGFAADGRVSWQFVKQV